ncbi:DUF1579 domain-containing protein [Brevundimonas lenta]|uniref:DUF1579 domain-containing protein n=1 Tax=Brevundimonas lenta TaxID=424796 RepID=A0A7W6NPF9_9CAUL|nr:DUF1579 domain-containing protein [Brevundimonas lenta]MBB4082112.1 hypothetical protein [Brevundimonas lenta]
MGEATEPTEQHRWLQALEGDWTWESWSIPEDPKCRWSGAETVSRYGDLWTVFEGKAQTPEGTDASSLRITLGYDPDKAKFVGSFISTMMASFWAYEGTLDPDGRILRLKARGPRFDGKPGEADYEDLIEVVSPDERYLRGTMQADDGTWTEFMVTRYRRKGAAG